MTTIDVGSNLLLLGILFIFRHAILFLFAVAVLALGAYLFYRLVFSKLTFTERQIQIGILFAAAVLLLLIVSR